MSAAAVIGSLLDFRRLDQLAAGDTVVHRLDARVKLLVTLAFAVCVMSFDRYDVAPLPLFFVFPLAMAALARLPAGFVWRKVALVLPMALLVALPNPWFDRATALHLGDWPVSGGWLSALSIVLRAALAAAAAFVLVAVTGFPALCTAMARLGLPQALVTQLLFLYRYLVVMVEETQAVLAAFAQRAGGRPLDLRLFATLAARLLLRTWHRAERIHRAMRARGFTGEMPAGPASRLRWPDLAFVALCGSAFLLLRLQNPAQLLGVAVMRALGLR